MPQANGSLSVWDYSKETGIMHVNLQDIDPTGTNYGSVTQDLDEIKDAILPLILGNVAYVNLALQFPENPAYPTDKNAQRERKWLVTYRDDTQYLGTGSTVANPGYGKFFTFEIPTANLSLLSNNSDNLDITSGAGLTAVTALNPNIRSPYNRGVAAGVTATNTIVSIKHVGRRN